MSPAPPFSDLPSSDSPSLALFHPSPEEKLGTWKLNGSSWQGRLSLEAYVRREEHLASQPATRDGGQTFWILADTASAPNSRTILASCESFRKRALVSREDGQVQEVTSHGIGSVFCNPELRGRGYAARMLSELGAALAEWQQKDGQTADFTVLYSDIGKEFYSKLGWEAFPSSHIALNPMVEQLEKQPSNGELPTVDPLYAKDLVELCQADEIALRAMLEKSRAGGSISVALLPDVDTIQLHHAREEFVAKELFGKWPDVKGAMIQGPVGTRVWCIWTRTFCREGITLNILRLVIENEVLGCETSDQAAALVQSDETAKRQVLAVTSVIRSACDEAAKWKLDDIQLWNPTPLTILAVRQIEPSVELIDRANESIASLRWHGPKLDSRNSIDWVANEKYGWC